MYPASKELNHEFRTALKIKPKKTDITWRVHMVRIAENAEKASGMESRKHNLYYWIVQISKSSFLFIFFWNT